MLKQTTCSMTSIIMTEITVEEFYFFSGFTHRNVWKALIKASSCTNWAGTQLRGLRGDETQSQNHFTETLNEF